MKVLSLLLGQYHLSGCISMGFPGERAVIQTHIENDYRGHYDLHEFVARLRGNRGSGLYTKCSC